MLPLLSDPSESTVFEQNIQNLERYMNLSPQDSKKIYVELLQAGMDKELLMTLFPYVFSAGLDPSSEPESIK